MRPGFGARRVQCLSFHADYACRNSGICCGSGWSIAVERPVERDLRRRLSNGGVHLPNGPDGFEAIADGPPNCDSALRLRGHTCWFRDEAAGLCALHRELGESILPSACRHFPRVCVLEPDRVAVSLSHYCPTAASLLFADRGDCTIVNAPRAFPSDWPFEGLDVQEGFSPFLRPGVLLGFDGLQALEAAAVDTFRAAPDVKSGLRQLERGLETVVRWVLGGPTVPDLIRNAFATPSSSAADGSSELHDPTEALRASLTQGAQAPDLPRWDPSVWTSRDPGPDVDRALRRYLAARAFGNWILFHGDDVRVLGSYLRLALETVHLFAAHSEDTESRSDRWVEAVRSADLWLMHHCDPELLARNLR